jgi:hypothetical protein
MQGAGRFVSCLLFIHVGLTWFELMCFVTWQYKRQGFVHLQSYICFISKGRGAIFDLQNVASWDESECLLSIYVCPYSFVYMKSIRFSLSLWSVFLFFIFGEKICYLRARDRSLCQSSLWTQLELDQLLNGRAYKLTNPSSFDKQL